MTVNSEELTKLMSRKTDPKSFADLGQTLSLLNDESTRGGVLLGAAILDDCLRKLLHNFMIASEKEVNKLLHNGPLGTFSARCLAAYCLGLISIDEFHDIELIREVRNSFAHDLMEANLENSAIKANCTKLMSGRAISDWSSMPSGDRLMIATAIMASKLALRALQIERQQQTQPFADVAKPHMGSEK